MPTKTNQTKATLAELQALEQELHEAREKRGQCGTRLRQLADQAQALLDERHRLINRDPALVDHRGSPVAENEVSKIDDQARELGDLGDVQAEHEHLKKIEAASQRKLDTYIDGNIDEVAEGVRPEAEAVAFRVIAKAAELDASLAEWIAVYQRSAGLIAPVRRLTGRDVPGVEQASGLRRQLRDFDIPAPYPRVTK